ncbi:hypothetical protein QL285_033988 [Trifolium repens]|nr:hypothetical protein QL285_033988 [Trifolium repens]
MFKTQAGYIMHVRKKCKWLGWCEPVEDDADGKSRVQTNDPSGDARMSNLEYELKKLDDLVDGMKKGMQEEFAPVKFELDNAIIATNKDVDKECKMLTMLSLLSDAYHILFFI